MFFDRETFGVPICQNRGALWALILGVGADRLHPSATGCSGPETGREYEWLAAKSRTLVCWQERVPGIPITPRPAWLPDGKGGWAITPPRHLRESCGAKTCARISMDSLRGSSVKIGTIQKISMAPAQG